MSGVILIATPIEVMGFDAGTGLPATVSWPGQHRPTGLAADPWRPSRVWCSTTTGILRSDDAGGSWVPAGLDTTRLMTVSASAAREGLVWAGADPTAVWRSDDGGESWTDCDDLLSLASAPTWAFPPKPETHHVRWLLPHALDPGRICAAIEAGALVRSRDGGATWIDRVPGGPYDTHELAAHPAKPNHLRSAAGDGYFESVDGGENWRSPMDGLDVRYLRSVAVDPGDPDVTLISGASGPRTAYVAGRSDGRVYRRAAGGTWSEVNHWGGSVRTIAPLLIPGRGDGEFWAADERGVHHSMDGGIQWKMTGALTRPPAHLRGVALVG